MRNRLFATVMSTVAGVALSTVLVAPAQAVPLGQEDTGDSTVSIDVFGFLGGILGGGAKARVEAGGGVRTGGGVKVGGGVKADAEVKGGGAKAGGEKARGGEKAGGGVRAGVKAGAEVSAGGDARGGADAGAGFSLEGTVRAVDKRAGILTVRGVTEGGSRSTLRIKIGVGATLRLDGAATVLGKIVLGARVQVGGTIRGSVRLATSVLAVTRFAVKGTVAAVNAAAGTLTVAAVSGVRAVGRTTIDLATNVVVTLNGVLSTLAALPLGASISVAGGVSVGSVSVTAKAGAQLGR